MGIYVDVCSNSLFKHGEELCGDMVEVRRLADSTLVVLADGLGSGVKANILATMTSKMLATMLTEGMELTDAVSTLAETLPVCKVRGVAYSTFTVLQVFSDGTVKLIEFDNPPVVFLRNGKYFNPEGEILDIQGKRVKVSTFPGQIGDMAALMSDGAVHAGIGHTLNLGWQWENIRDFLQDTYRDGMTAGEMTSSLLGACADLYMNKAGDDTTVACVKLRRAQPVDILIGPPVNPEDDEMVVNRFIDGDGIKIICGGTTSQIVSRVTGRPLQVDLKYFSKDVPPMATIPGIDLVCEGVLTFGNALEHIKAYLEKDGGRNLPCELEGEDGGSRIAKVLLEQATSVRMIVGRAMNPAHQNPNLPLNFGIKLRLVEEMQTALLKLGKKVTVEQY